MTPREVAGWFIESVVETPKLMLAMIKDAAKYLCSAVQAK